jgi:hypothetical protein
LPREWNWDEFAREVVARRAATPVALTLERAQAELGADIPPEVLVSLHLASQNVREQAAWRLAHVAFSDPRRATLHLLSLMTLPQRAGFAREMVAVGMKKLLGAARSAKRSDRVKRPC